MANRKRERVLEDAQQEHFSINDSSDEEEVVTLCSLPKKGRAPLAIELARSCATARGFNEAFPLEQRTPVKIEAGTSSTTDAQSFFDIRFYPVYFRNELGVYEKVPHVQLMNVLGTVNGNAIHRQELLDDEGDRLIATVEN